jgi:hypothetical protein
MASDVVITADGVTSLSATYNGQTILNTSGSGTHTLACNGKVMASDIGVSAVLAPVGYVIPAGTYYGKASPSITSYVQLPLLFYFDTYDGSAIEFDNGTSKIVYEYIPARWPEYMTVYENGSWNATYRTITVTTDTTVTQDEYNAFFACFDYAFVMQDMSGGDSVHAFANGQTWQQFVTSAYNTNSEFSATPYGGDNVMCIDNPEYKVDYVLPIATRYVYFNGFMVMNSNADPVSSSDMIANTTYLYQSGGGGGD